MSNEDEGCHDRRSLISHDLRILYNIGKKNQRFQKCLSMYSVYRRYIWILIRRMQGWRKINEMARTKVDERKISKATKSKVSKIRESDKKRKR